MLGAESEQLLCYSSSSLGLLYTLSNCSASARSLPQRLAAQAQQIQALSAANAALEARLNALEQTVAGLQRL